MKKIIVLLFGLVLLSMISCEYVSTYETGDYPEDLVTEYAIDHDSYVFNAPYYSNETFFMQTGLYKCSYDFYDSGVHTATLLLYNMTNIDNADWFVKEYTIIE